MKKNIGSYQCYNLYDVTDGKNSHYYIATSCYLSEGFITCSGDTQEELKRNIDKTVNQIKVNSILCKNCRNRD